MINHNCPRMSKDWRGIYTITPSIHCDTCFQNRKTSLSYLVPKLPDLREWMKGDANFETDQLLVEYFSSEMPYGTQKARDGDPYDWLSNNPDLVEELIAEIELYYPEAS